MSERSKPIRCAIYTRKSSEEGLEQNFNSLDAQREACSAYIQSQRHEGWREVTAAYEDGGYSGGNLERPALQRLLADIKARKVDLIVVYKIDRLTRSLTDFASLVGVFDAHQTSFVSVTQSFNTTTSMGRLTLNVLLSFAQFEREITGERIRDKIQASKRKGLWMGGTVPLGYNSIDKKLIVVPDEAAQVKRIFTLYRESASVQKLQERLFKSNEVSKVRITRSGKSRGGQSFSRGALYLILKNQVYRGQIPHHDAYYPGEHEAIIDQRLWDDVQALLASNREARHLGQRARASSLLAGLVFDDTGRPLTPSHTAKGGKRYRYYISRLASPSSSPLPQLPVSIPAHDLERLVLEQVESLLKSPDLDRQLLNSEDRNAHDAASVLQAGQTLGEQWKNLKPVEQRQWLTSIIRRIEVGSDWVALGIRRQQLWSSLLTQSPTERKKGDDRSAREDDVLRLTIPARLRRCGNEIRIIHHSAPHPTSISPHHATLLNAIARARGWYGQIESGGTGSMAAIARHEGLAARYVSRLLRCAFLAPDIIESLLAGSAPAEMSLARVLEGVPLDWAEQRQRFGFSSIKNAAH
jgi:site-specific DNA recombinase